MKQELMDILVCPMCKGPLTLETDENSESAILKCEACSKVYPIEDGIPNLLPPDLRNE